MSLSQRGEKEWMVTEAIKARMYYVGVQTVILKEFLIIYYNNTRFFLSTWFLNSLKQNLKKKKLSPMQRDSYMLTARKQAIRVFGDCLRYMTLHCIRILNIKMY